MSAYLVNPEHIAALAQYAAANNACIYGKFYVAALNTANDISDCLAKANLLSIAVRYGESENNDIYIQACRKFTTYNHNLTLLDLASMVACLDYQCCEPENWYESKAFEVLQSINTYILSDMSKNVETVRDYSL